MNFANTPDARYRPTTFTFDEQNFYIFGGPIAQAPEHAFRVRLAPEVRVDCEITVPVRDFGIPDNFDHWRAAALKLIRVGLKGKVMPYTGCMGGIGRTGMMLATIAKILGEDAPVAWVRTHYRRGAVETVAQERFVADLDVKAEQGWLRRRRQLRRATLGLIPW
jgi:hypothetical protein